MFLGTPAGVTFGDSGTAAPEGWWKARPRDIRAVLCVSLSPDSGSPRPGTREPSCEAGSHMPAEAFLSLRPSGGGVCCPQTGPGAGAQQAESPPPQPRFGPGHTGRAALTCSLCARAEGRGTQLSLCSSPAPGPRASGSPGGAARLGTVLQAGSSSLRKLLSDVQVTGVLE